MSSPRLDERGIAHKGSHLQTQIYVNRRQRELEVELCDALHGLPSDARFRWVSPLESEGYKEYYDGPFLDALELSEHRAALSEFWPRRGPEWDALAIIETSESDRPHVLLAEGKGHPNEFESSCAAGDESRLRIEAALDRTRRDLNSTADLDQWLDGHYQTANRLAYLDFLRSRGVRAWFAYLLFYGDVGHIDATHEELCGTLENAYRELGIEKSSMPNVGHVLLEARERDELPG